MCFFHRKFKSIVLPQVDVSIYHQVSSGRDSAKKRILVNSGECFLRMDLFYLGPSDEVYTNFVIL